MKSIKIFLITITILIFSACGGGNGEKSLNQNSQNSAISKIQKYAKDGKIDKLTIDDYRVANFHAVTTTNIQQYNNLVLNCINTNKSLYIELDKLDARLNQKPIAHSQNISLNENSEINITLTGEDEDIENLAYEIVSQPSHGVVESTYATVSGRMAHYTYRPNRDYDGSDSFSFRVFDGREYSDAVRVNITIVDTTPNTPPIANAGDDKNITEGESVTVDGTHSSDSDGNIVSYLWEENSQSLGTQSSLTLNNLSVGTHTITLTVTDNDGATNSDSVTIVVNPRPVQPPRQNTPPTANAGDDKNITEGESVTVDGTHSSDSDGNIVSYLWEENSQNLGTQSSLTLNNLSVGTHIITLTVTDNDGATNSDSVTIVVNPLFREDEYFITTWKTDNEGGSENNQIAIKLNPDYEYNFYIDWGDNNSDKNVTNDINHTYSSVGTYTIKIAGEFPSLYFNVDDYYTTNDSKKLLSVEQWGTNQWKSMRQAFANCENMVINASDNPNLSNVTDMSSMFYKASSFNQYIGDWDVSNITNMSYMFYQASNFNQDIGTWNVSKVTNMEDMFAYASNFNQDIGRWNVSNVTNMVFMFSYASKFNQDIGNWNVSNVTDMAGMFENATNFNQNIGDWDVSNVTYMYNMFYNATNFNQNIGNWNVSNVINMGSMFNGATNFNQNIGNWDVSKVTNMWAMFSGAESFNQNLGNWNVSNVSYMDSMFSGVTLSTSNYDSLLIGWSELNLQENVNFDAGDSKYSQNAQSARDIIITDYYWNISDGGLE